MNPEKPEQKRDSWGDIDEDRDCGCPNDNTNCGCPCHIKWISPDPTKGLKDLL